MMRDYRFSEDWFSDIGISHVLPLGNKEEFHILEIEVYKDYLEVLSGDDSYRKIIRKK